MSEEELKNRIREWREKRGLSQAALGDLVGSSQQQVHKLENGDIELRTHHLRQYAKALRVRPLDILPPSLVDDDVAPLEVREDDADAWLPASKTPFDPVPALLHDDPNRSAWVLKSEALILEGYRPGDILILDQSRQAAPGDIVCAQIYEGDSARTVFRIFQPPYIMTATTRADLRDPLPVDGRRVKIMGTVTESLRLNAAA